MSITGHCLLPYSASFDVVKLWPAKALENLHGGHGILMDDIAAGFQTLIVLIF